MSYVYRQRHTSTGDVIDGAWWNANQNEFAGMFNGGLDRDNIEANTITGAMLVNGACVEVQYEEGGGVSTNMAATEWQTVDSYTLTADVDTLVEVDWSGGWTWNGAWSRGVSGDATTYVADTVSIRVTIDGVTVCESGPSEDLFSADHVALVGAAPVSAGTHTVDVQYLVAQRNYYDLSIAGVCTNTLTFQFRDLVLVQRRR